MYFVGINMYFNKFQNEVILRNTTRRYHIKMSAYQQLTTGNVLKSISSFCYFSDNSTIFLEIHYKISSFQGTNGKTVSWLMFKYDTSDYLYANPIEVSSPNIVHYKNIEEIKGIQIFNTKSFKIKQEGWYYINLGISAKGSSFLMFCFVNNKTIDKSGFLIKKNYLSDTTSKAFIQYFKGNDIFHCKVKNGRIRYFQGSSITIFKLKVGKYNPIISVATEKNYPGTGKNYPMPFSKIFLNEGNCWDKLTKEYFITVPGVYFMYFGVGSANRRRVFIEIILNDKIYATVERSEYERDFEIISRTLLLKLNIGDKVSFRANSNSGFTSNYYSTNFIMFIVSAK